MLLIVTFLIVLGPGAKYNWAPGKPFNVREWPMSQTGNRVALPASQKGIRLDKVKGEESAVRITSYSISSSLKRMQVTTTRLAHNIVVRSGSILLSGSARCLECVARVKRRDPCGFGCVVSNENDDQACAGEFYHRSFIP